MADVEPFRGWRYDLAQVGDLSDVTAPPYDVINPDEQQELYEKHPCNVIRLILNREEPGDPDGKTKYQRAATFLNRWQSEGILIQEHETALYVYHQEFEWEGTTYTRKGFLGRLRLEEFESGHVFPHEQTFPKHKADRLALMNATGMNLSPIFGLFPDEELSIQSILEQAVLTETALEATDELGVVHRFWPITDESTIRTVSDRMTEKPIFIADGHHRYETALNYRREQLEKGDFNTETDSPNFVMMMFVGMSDPGLAILPTHRLVSGIAELSALELRNLLQDHFELTPMGNGKEAAKETWNQIDAAGGQHLFGFGTADGEWQLAKLIDGSPMQKLAADQSEDWRNLGVSLLHRLVLDHLIQEKFSEAEIEWKYVHLMEEVTTAQQAKECQLACLVAPASLEHVKSIASQFEKMPPKSTYFYPKLLSGIVFHSLEGS